MNDLNRPALTRRDLLTLIGKVGGGAALYQAMCALGLAAESPYQGPLDLSGAPSGASVLILGAGLAGLVAAYELRNAGYRVQILEYNDRIGGRNWTLRGGDTYTELGGLVQRCEFDPGLYINPGPWRIPYHHHGILSYCKRLNVPLEPFIQINYNAYLHASRAFGGKPQRFRQIKADYQGQLAELFAKSARQKALDAELSAEDREKLLESLRHWGALDDKYSYRANFASSSRRGFDKKPGGGLAGRPVWSTPIGLKEVLDSNLWFAVGLADEYDMQTTLFQPVGGMDRISAAFARELTPLVRFGTKVTEIDQSPHGVTVIYEDKAAPGAKHQARADWCLCTIPLPILAQIPMKVGEAMSAAIAAVPYAASVKVGLQFKRRFWEEDEQIYGGISFTDLPISLISYPSTGFQAAGKGVLLGAYAFGLNAMDLTGMSPEQRVQAAVKYGSQIHSQYRDEFENGIAVAWHRSPSTMGCFSLWTEESRARHYENLCQIDGRIALAGEHASYLNGWQEGAVTSSLDAIQRLHRRAVAAGSRS